MVSIQLQNTKTFSRSWWARQATHYQVGSSRGLSDMVRDAKLEVLQQVLCSRSYGVLSTVLRIAEIHIVCQFNSSIVFAKLSYYNFLLIFTLTTSVGQTSGRYITQLAKMSIDPIFIELAADVFRIFYQNAHVTHNLEECHDSSIPPQRPYHGIEHAGRFGNARAHKHGVWQGYGDEFGVMQWLMTKLAMVVKVCDLASYEVVMLSLFYDVDAPPCANAIPSVQLLRI